MFLGIFFHVSHVGKNEIDSACSMYGEGDEYSGLWWGNLRQGEHLEGPGVDGRIILRWIFRKRNGGHGLNRSGSEYREEESCCECGNDQ